MVAILAMASVLALTLLLCFLTTSGHYVDKNNFFKNDERQIVIIRGASFVNKKDDMINIPDEDMQRLGQEWGMNAARLGFLWNLLEPVQGVYNETYLAEMEDVVKRFAKYNISVLLDMHQDLWAPNYCGHGFPDFYAYPENNSLYQKGGLFTFPEPIGKPKYAANETGPFPPITNCDEILSGALGWEAGYVSFALNQAAEGLYQNRNNALTRFGDMWELIAKRFKNYDNVLGYELINEPWFGDVFRHPSLVDQTISDILPDKDRLQPTYEYLHRRIRAVDNDTMIFFEPGIGGNSLMKSGFTAGPGGHEYNDRQALSYHMYCSWNIPTFHPKHWWERWLVKILHLSSDAVCDDLMRSNMKMRVNDVRKLGIAGLITEYGAIYSKDEDKIRNTQYLQDLFDENLVGSIYWTDTSDWTHWKEPAYGLPRNDLSESWMEKVYTRTYAMATSGTPVKMFFDSITAAFTYTYRIDTSIKTPTAIFVNENYYYHNSLVVAVEPPAKATATHVSGSFRVLVSPTKDATNGDTITVSIKPKPARERLEKVN